MPCSQPILLLPPRHPLPSLPAKGSLAPPLNPCKCISGSLALQPFSPPPHPTDNVNTSNSPIPAHSLSQEPQGRAWTSQCSSVASPPEHLPYPHWYLIPWQQGWCRQPPAPHHMEHPHPAPGSASSHLFLKAWKLITCIGVLIPTLEAGMQFLLQQPFTCPYFGAW